MNLFRSAPMIAVVLGAPSLVAATVTTQLSADETSVGGVVQLQLRVDGTTNVSPPTTLQIDGLDVRLTGRQTLVQLDNGTMSTSGVYTYTIVPLREGTFEIPAFEVNADGRPQKTTPQKLVVQPGTAPAPRPAPGTPMPPGGRTQRSSSDSQDDLAYAEMIVPKKTIYAGEVVPVEIRFYFSERVGFRVRQDGPQVSGEGFTVQKLSPPSQTDETVGDANYRVLTFKTSITAVKSGEMPLPKVELNGILSLPTRTPAGMDSLFGQMFGGGMSDEREVSIASKPRSIRVKALPAEGRPANFSGAVGDFTLAASVDPAKAAPGDPVTLKISVSGRGNFDAMGEPKLLDIDGWRTYPPTSRFTKDDSIGYGGTKVFEMPMVAQKPQTRTPVAEFSYFDPDKAKYFTLKSEAMPIDAAANPTATPAAVAIATATPSPSPAANQAGNWIATSKTRSWQPVLKSPAFWVFNGTAAVAVIALVSAVSVRRSRSGAAGQRAAIVRQRDRLLAELGRDRGKEDDFFEQALQVLALQAGLAGEAGPFELVRALEARGRNVGELHTVLARADEIKFAGGGGMAVRLDAEERRRIVRVLLEVCR